TLVASLWVTATTAAHGGMHLEFWVPVSFAAGSLIPTAFVAFMHAYVPAEGIFARHISRILLSFSVVIGILFIVLSLTTYLVGWHDPSLSGNVLSRRHGPLYPFFAFFIVATWATATALFLLEWRVARGRSRAELQFVAAGMIVPGIAAIVTNVLLPWLTGRSAYGAIGPYFALAFVVIIGHALIRRRITDLRLVLHNSLTLALATAASLIPPVVLLQLFGSRFFGHLDGVELMLVLGTIGLVILSVPPTRDLARRLLDRYVYRTRANYQRTVREASRALTRMLDLKRLLPFISTTVIEATGVEGVAIYLLDEDGFQLALTRQRPK